MKIAFISDIHSNLEALEATLASLDEAGADRIICLGDVVGYNANPNECIEIMKYRQIPAVMGNHDMRAAGLREPRDFNPVAAEAILWTRKTLTEESRAYLEYLPPTIKVSGTDGADDIIAFHGWLGDVDNYILGAGDAEENFELIRLEGGTGPGAVCFFGHTHIPAAFVKSGAGIQKAAPGEVAISGDASYLLNPGSVGQPRDRDTRASIAVFDTVRGVVQWSRVEYDVDETARKVVDAGLPPLLAQRLKEGW